jgi:acyl-CoA thioesterase I
VTGVGDLEHLGWAGRLCVPGGRAGLPVTRYVLGVRRQTEVAAGDGAHPGAAGYADIADLVRPHWLRWLTG